MGAVYQTWRGAARRQRNNRRASLSSCLDPWALKRYGLALSTQSSPNIHPLARLGSPVQWLAVLAIVEFVLNRVVVPALRHAYPQASWVTYIDYAALFAFYFASTLGVISLVLVARSLAPNMERTSERSERDTKRKRANIMALSLVLLGAASGIAMLASPGTVLSRLLDGSLLIVAILAVAFSFSHSTPTVDWGTRLGVLLFVAPFAVHIFSVALQITLSNEEYLEVWSTALGSAAKFTMCAAALLSPYCFAPRPLTVSLRKVLPVFIAMSLATAGALLLRYDYVGTALAVDRAVGVEISTLQADPTLALYLLGISTLLWTLLSCALAPSRARRFVGLGLGLVVLGGAGLQWPIHFALWGTGLGIVVLASRYLIEEGIAQYASQVPVIDDTIWSGYVSTLSKHLRSQMPQLAVLTTRSDEDAAEATTMMKGDLDQTSISIKIIRRAGVVEMLSVNLGKEQLWHLPNAAAANVLISMPHVQPLLAPACLGDVHSNGLADRVVQGDAAWAPLQAAMNGIVAPAGWIAHWQDATLHWQHVPSQDGNLDFPVPLHDLAQRNHAQVAVAVQRLTTLLVALSNVAKKIGVPSVATEQQTSI
jgi:hypothetical protein